MAKDGEPGEGKAVRRHRRDRSAPWTAKVVTLHSKIKARFTEMDAEGKLVTTKVIDTTPGRMKIAALLPRHPKIGHRLVEKPLTKKEIGNLIDIVYRHCGQKATVIFADQIMGLGFKEAAKAGISFGKDDIIIPETQEGQLVAETKKLAEEYEQQYADGLITKRREVQQGRRRLGQGHRPRRRRDDGARSRPSRRPPTAASWRSTPST